jgi:uncharacterized coiled-coil protein SlyX
MTTELERRIAQLEATDKGQAEHCKDQLKECTGLFRVIDNRLGDGSKKMALNEAELKALKKEQTRQYKQVENITGKIDKIGNKLEERDQKIMEKVNGLEIALLVGRPSWAVALILCAALSIITGFAVSALL